MKNETLKKKLFTTCDNILLYFDWKTNVSKRYVPKFIYLLKILWTMKNYNYVLAVFDELTDKQS